MNTYAKNRILANADANRGRILKTIIWLSVVCAFVYMYCVGSIVFNIVARKSIENDNKKIASDIAETQVEYLAKIGEIDKSFAYAKGYVDPVKPAYVTSKPLVSFAR
jgi:hypothetical protein